MSILSQQVTTRLQGKDKTDLQSQTQTQMSRDMWFSTMWHFDKCRLRRACVASKWCSDSNLTVIEYSSG